jgi:hypothetical protein
MSKCGVVEEFPEEILTSLFNLSSRTEAPKEP